MKKIIIPAVIFSLILISSIWILGRFKSKPQQEVIIPTPTQVLPTISEDIKVNLTSQNNNRVVVLNISGIPSDVESVEYELTYLTGAGLPRGVLGKITADGQSEIERNDIVLGTCSSGKCVYDSGVESIDLALKFNSQNGASVYRKTFPL
ncbi:hypothetical protein A2W14_03685 [Candidatus Gottesmanbacteria bacterium RBG_16_37_8]|uniref:Uncharacterized protein n=1 Tax=Candidatus Gottesmanbacteria bacterium RBG_16_37_8 TaxID=1798371 RepID=A0A1F5YT13_9BACT|nr:MAG: hypothetical protein A2W14_03685 [Candidatus Gottesmanbacteria bacterium RBG_16_37_8]